MTVTYKGLWKLLIEKGLQKQDLVNHAGLSSATVAKMGRGEPVSNKVLVKICDYLECNVNDIIKISIVKTEVRGQTPGKLIDTQKTY